MPHLFDPPRVFALPVAGTPDSYPVSRLFCVGRNYEAHAAEMGQTVDREKPFYFTKSVAHAVHEGATVPYPPGTSDFHFEMELAIALSAPAFRATAEDGAAAIGWATAALDMTRRDLQISERRKQRPWSLGKDVEGSAVLSALVPVTAAALGPQRIWLSQNGAVRQQAHLRDMVWSPAEIVAHLSGFYHLQPGDVILTGTPAGVGAVAPGDRIEGGIDGIATIGLTIGEPA